MPKLLYYYVVEKFLDNKPLAITALGILVVLFCLAVWGPDWMRPTSFNAQNLPATPAGVDATSTPPVDEHAHYIQITDGCGPYYDSGACVNMRSGPGTSYPAVEKLRTGIVLKVEPQTVAGEGYEWYKIIFDESLRYPERVAGDWYVAVNPEAIEPIENFGDVLLTDESPPTSKRIIVDLSDEMLYAYDGDELFMQEPISTGLELTPTPMGTFRVFKKTPSRYMQGPIPEVSDQYYDLPGVPWNLYFTHGGAVIHGAYWHDHFGSPWSHGCVNLPPEKAKELYMWADVGLTVTVRP